MGKRLPSIKLTEEEKAFLEKRGFKIGKAINSGEYGVVYSATRKVDTGSETSSEEDEGEKCAAKVIDTKGPMDRKDLSREIYMMNRIKHKHVVEVFDIFFVKPSHVIIFMELAEGGDLCELLADERSWLDEYRVSRYYRQFGDALRYMHLIGFAHRDIKLENILLVDQERTLTKVTDFGFARPIYCPELGKRVMASTWCGTVDYMGPEIIVKALMRDTAKSDGASKPKISYDPTKADVWSTGVLLYLLLNDDFPFGGKGKEKEIYRMQMAREYKFINDSLTDGAKEVIDMHFEPNPQKRPSMEKILSHSWFDEDCWLSSEGA